jgi:hypothetical protein
MAILSAAANHGLRAFASHDGEGVTGTLTIGANDTIVTLPNCNVGYVVKMEIAAGDTVTLDAHTGAVTGATAGTAQVETATVVAAAGATSSGNLAVTVIAAGVTGSPLAFSVALVSGVDTTASLIAAKIRTALVASSALTALYTVGGTGANVVFTRTVPAANDATLNIAITAGLGVSAIVSSSHTTAGVQPTKIYRIAGQTYDGEDYQGVALPTIADLKGIEIAHLSGATDIAISTNNWGRMYNEEVKLLANAETLVGPFNTDPIEFTADAASVLRVTIIGIA